MQNLGKDRIQLEEDILIVRWIGELRKEDMEEIFLHLYNVKRTHGHVFVLVDARKAGKLPADARKVASSHSLPVDAIAAVMFGASFASTIVLNMANAAYTLLSGKTAMTIHAVETEEAARAWIDARRRERRHA